MNLVEWLQHLMTNFGAGWVMWLLIALSVLSVAVMLERGWFYWSLRDDIGRLAKELRDRLRSDDMEGAKKLLEADKDYQVVNSELEELKFQYKDLQEIMSHHLVTYFSENQTTQITDDQGETRSVILKATIGKAEALFDDKK